MMLVPDEIVPLAEGDRSHVFHVPTSSFYEVGPEALQLLAELAAKGPVEGSTLAGLLPDLSRTDAGDLIEDMLRLRLLVPPDERGNPGPMRDKPSNSEGIRNLVLHVAHNCNLACTYCYADHGKYQGKAMLMDAGQGRRYVDWLFEQSAEHNNLGITFFGGEPMLNLPVVRDVARYAQETADRHGKSVRFSMTTNGTLITPEGVDFLESIDCQVTVSLDAVGKQNDRLRPFHSGKGSYDMIMERIVPLLERRAVAARVTVTRKNLDVVRTVETLLEAGFTEVGCSPVDAKDPAYDLRGEDYERLLEDFSTLSQRFVSEALQGRLFGFSNIKNLLRAIHDGQNKEYPCGAGIQMVAGAPNGDMSLCHRFVGEDDYVLGNVERGGIDRNKRLQVLGDIRLDQRSDCGSCWARYICSGGCHHVNFLFEGSPQRTYLTHCDYLRDWYLLGLQTYATLVSEQPDFFDSPLQVSGPCKQ